MEKEMLDSVEKKEKPEKTGFFCKIELAHPLLSEIIRYLIVGGLATIVDWTMYYLCTNVLLKEIENVYYISVTIGFVLGLLVNYFLSIFFVFKKVKDEKRSRSFLSFLIFLFIGIIGLGITNIGMFLGEKIINEAFNINYVNMLVRCFLTGIVLIWNYVARKIIIFK